MKVDKVSQGRVVAVNTSSSTRAFMSKQEEESSYQRVKPPHGR